MKIKLILKKSVFLAAAMIVLAQLKAQTINYKIVENNPDKYNLFVYLNPLNAQIHFSDAAIGYQLQAQYLLNEQLQFDLDFRKAYNDANVRLFSPKDLSKASQFQIGACYNLKSKLVSKSHKVVVKSTNSGKYTTNTFFRGDAMVRSIVAARGGFQYFHNNFKVSNDINIFAGTHPKELQAYDDKNILHDVYDSSSFETINYKVKSYGIYAGIDFKSIKDVVFDVEDYGKKHQTILYNFYLDALVAPSVILSLRPNEGQKQNYEKTNINIKENKRKYLGWRFGAHMVVNRKVGFNVKAECGQQPGPVNVSAWFINAGIGMNLCFNTKGNK
jgi:hypothetical protein